MAAANLADRYISDRHLPDKAIDLIDESAATADQADGDSAGVQGTRGGDRRCRPPQEEAVEGQQFEEAGRSRQGERAPQSS